MAADREVLVPVPGSKSEAIRAILVGALAKGTTRVLRAPGSDDVLAVLDAARALGVRIDGRPGAGAVRVRGTRGEFPPGERRLDLRGSATGLRMLAAVAALRKGRTVLDGDASLRRRPAGPLVEPLRALGVRVSTRSGLPPVTVSGGPARPPGREVAVDAGATSQVLSGLLLVGPLLPGGLRIRVKGRAVSGPYVDLTVEALRRAGVRVRRAGRVFSVEEGIPSGGTAAIEADWSSGAFALAAGAIRRRRVRVPGLRVPTRQGDSRVLHLLRAAGARCGCDGDGAWCEGPARLRPFRVDLRETPDLAPVAAVLALFAPGESRVTGAAHLRAKESDRIAACVAGVRALGGRARALRGGFVVRGGTPAPGEVDSGGDHRIALAFAVAAAAVPGARVRGTDCVRKSWPDAFDALRPLLV